MRCKLLLVLCAGIFLSSIPAFATPFPSPGPKDKCPVCGMFVHKYQDFLGAIAFKDGRTLWFDGAKDLFKYYVDPTAYGGGHKPEEIKTILVTDYYAVALIDARTAWYVFGSDVFGPMGHELIPFAKEAAAREFMADHGGKRLLLFKEIDAGLLKGFE
jgi:nitrous oxide reductase accessory protein NosL